LPEEIKVPLYKLSDTAQNVVDQQATELLKAGIYERGDFHIWLTLGGSEEIGWIFTRLCRSQEDESIYAYNC
jgi:hypothetical protein